MDILILLGLIGLSAIISAAEIGFFSVNETKLQALVQVGHKRAAIALQLRSNPQRLLSTIMIGDNLVNAGAASYVTLLTIRLFGSEARRVTATGNDISNPDRASWRCIQTRPLSDLLLTTWLWPSRASRPPR